MKSMFWVKIAYKNIIDNKKYYFANVFVNLITITIFYLFIYVSSNSNISQVPGYKSLMLILFLGNIFVGLFTLIFKFYSNSFFLKRRKKEMGLYSVWGLEKKNINSILLYESVYIYILSIILGIGLGIIFQNSILSYLLNLMHYNEMYKLDSSIDKVWITVIVFFVFDLAIYTYNIINIGFKSTIELLKEETIGEQRVKVNKRDIFNGILGVIITAVIYIYVQTDINIVNSMFSMFIALIIACLGSYLILSSFITIVIMLFKKNKKLYYKNIIFQSVAKVAYRIKQNTVGLTAICILLTCMICGLSATIALYIGTERQVEESLYLDGLIILNEKDDIDVCKNKIYNSAAETDLEIERFMKYSLLTKGIFYDRNENAFELEGSNFIIMNVIMIDDFNSLEGSGLTLEEGEVYIASVAEVSDKSRVSIFNNVYYVKSTIDSFILLDVEVNSIYDDYFIIVNDIEEMNRIKEAISTNREINISHYFEYLTDGDKKHKADYNTLLKNKLGEIKSIILYMNKTDIWEETFATNSIYLFIGFSLSLMMIIYMVFIMYYKQIQEAIDDIDNIQRMWKIGMDNTDINKVILVENGLLFIFPIILAALHTIAFYEIICKVLKLLTLTDKTLISNSIIGIFIATLIVYLLMYAGSFILYKKITSKKNI